MEVDVDAGGERDEARVIAKLAGNPDNSILGILAACKPETDDGFERSVGRWNGPACGGMSACLAHGE